MSTHSIEIPHDELAKFCQRHHIHQLSLFGSILRGDFNEDSDIDVLVEFEEEHTLGLRVITIENELSQLFGGRKVDMVNPKYLNTRLKQRILDRQRFNIQVKIVMRSNPWQSGKKTCNDS